MNEILKTTLLGLFFGTFGTTIGGILGIVIKKNSNKFLSFILSFASGLMMSVICFDLIPEALGISNIYGVVFGVLIGIISMIFCDVIVQKKFNKKQQKYTESNDLLKTGIIVSIGLAIHNFPEGLAIGSGFEASMSLGIGLAIAICLHDIPEGRFQSRQWKKCLKNNLEFVEAEVRMVPNTYVKLSEKDAERMENFLEKLDDLDDVSDVYHNWDEE